MIQPFCHLHRDVFLAGFLRMVCASCLQKLLTCSIQLFRSLLRLDALHVRFVQISHENSILEVNFARLLIVVLMLNKIKYGR